MPVDTHDDEPMPGQGPYDSTISRLLDEHGGRFLRLDTKDRPVGLNQLLWAECFAHEVGVKYDELESQYWLYQSHGPKVGTWRRATVKRMNTAVAAFVRGRIGPWGMPCEAFQCIKGGEISAVVNFVAGLPEVQTRDPLSTRSAGVVYFRNGRLQVDKAGKLTFEENGWRREDFATHKLDFDYMPNAKPRRFYRWLRRMVGGRMDDADAIVTWLGLALVRQRNDRKKVLLITGNANLGKSRLALIVSALLGEEASMPLEVKKLDGNFAASRYRLATFLSASECGKEFLATDGAEELKRYCGADEISVELKNSNERIRMRGLKNILLCSNYRQRVRISSEDNRNAWKARLIFVEADGKGYEKAEQDSELESTIVVEEGPGIMALAVLAAQRIQRQNGIDLSDRQQERLRVMLSESESIERFLEEAFVRDPAGEVLSDPVQGIYENYCVKRGWEPFSAKEFRKALDQHMTGLGGKYDHRRGDRRTQRGWYGVSWKEEISPKSKPAAPDKNVIEFETAA